MKEASKMSEKWGLLDRNERAKAVGSSLPVHHDLQTGRVSRGYLAL